MLPHASVNLEMSCTVDHIPDPDTVACVIVMAASLVVITNCIGTYSIPMDK